MLSQNSEPRNNALLRAIIASVMLPHLTMTMHNWLAFPLLHSVVNAATVYLLVIEVWTHNSAASSTSYQLSLHSHICMDWYLQTSAMNFSDNDIRGLTVSAVSAVINCCLYVARGFYNSRWLVFSNHFGILSVTFSESTHSSPDCALTVKCICSDFSNLNPTFAPPSASSPSTISITRWFRRCRNEGITFQ